jgi:phage/plasmid-like protein (TIGR03299 family)
LQAKLPEGVTVAGEQIDEYLLLSNGHDGGASLQVMFTPVRVFCQNTLAYAIKKAKNRVTIRHTGDTTLKLNEARRILDIGFNYFEEVKRIGEEAAGIKISDADFDKFLLDLVPDPKGEKANKTRAENKRADIRFTYRTSENLNDIRGTNWGVYNAVAEYVDHVVEGPKSKTKEEKAEARLERTIFAPSLKDEAAKVLLPA